MRFSVFFKKKTGWIPLRNGFKEPRHDGMKLYGADTGNAFRLGQSLKSVFLEIKNRIMHLRLHYFRSNFPDFPPQIASHGYHKTAKPALEILAKRPFPGPKEGMERGCRTTRLADFELNFEGKIRKKPGGIHRA